MVEERKAVQRVKATIIKLGIKSGLLAERMAIQPTRLSEILTGRRQMRIWEYAALCHELGEPMEAFWADEHPIDQFIRTELLPFGQALDRRKIREEWHL